MNERAELNTDTIRQVGVKWVNQRFACARFCNDRGIAIELQIKTSHTNARVDNTQIDKTTKL